MAPARRLVLASASASRLAVLRAGGFDPEVIVSGVDENAPAASDTRSLVRALAITKARAVASNLDDALVIGCDSMLEIDGEPFGKPETDERVRARWRRMAGRSGALCTGHCVIDAASGREACGVVATVVHFGTPTERELTAYVATGEPRHVAGAFTLEGRSAPFIRGIEGDPGNVTGLSLPLLRTLLAELDVEITTLWV